MKNKALIKSGDGFVNELTTFNVIEKNLVDKKQIWEEYKNNYTTVYGVLIERLASFN